MPYFLKKENEGGKPAYRVYERVLNTDVLVDENYYRFVLTTSTQSNAIYSLRVEGQTLFYRFIKRSGRMKEITLGTFEMSMYREMAKTPKELGKPTKSGFGSRGLKKPVRMWYVRGSRQADRAIEAHRQKVLAGKATLMDMDTQIVDQETLAMAQSALTRGQSFVFLPQEEAEPVKDNQLLKYPTALNGKTCQKLSTATVSAGKNPLVEMNVVAFSFAGTQAAMSDCNAFTHAVENNAESGTTPAQSWEWLHVRGKQMGGDFVSTNLVAGTYHGNSSMIEFENALTAHARYFAANAELSSSFVVTWSANCKPANSHVGEWILVEWEVNYSSPDQKQLFTDNAEYKLFVKRGRFAFEACRKAIWTGFESEALKQYCRSGS